MTRREVDEIKGHVDAALAENRQHVDAAIAENREHVDAAIAENREHVDAAIAENSEHLDAAIADTKQHVDAAIADTKQLLAETRAELETRITDEGRETRREFGILAEEMRGLVRGAGEGADLNGEKITLLEQRADRQDERIDGVQLEARAGCSKLDRRVTALEKKAQT